MKVTVSNPILGNSGNLQISKVLFFSKPIISSIYSTKIGLENGSFIKRGSDLLRHYAAALLLL